MTNYQTIAVLLTCHNRRETTLECLESLYKNTIPNNFSLDVFLVDDGSTDGTGETVKLKFPDVHVIQGDGNLYWNKGMRLAWETAARFKDYDYYLWLNDDTLIDADGLIELLDCYDEALKLEGNESLIVGTCRNDSDIDTFSYGGRNHDVPIIPNGSIQKCNFINGNLVLVPKEIYNTIGNLSTLYTHTMGDNDYGLRALRAGFNCFITRRYIATCPANGLPSWCNPKIPFVKRFKNLYSPKGLNMKEYMIFLKKHKRKNWQFSVLKVFAKTISPTLYIYFSEKQIKH